MPEFQIQNIIPTGEVKEFLNVHKYSTQEPFWKHCLRTYSNQTKGKNLKTEFTKRKHKTEWTQKPCLLPSRERNAGYAAELKSENHPLEPETTVKFQLEQSGSL